jgi:hypothetical protein
MVLLNKWEVLLLDHASVNILVAGSRSAESLLYKS